MNGSVMLCIIYISAFMVLSISMAIWETISERKKKNRED